MGQLALVDYSKCDPSRCDGGVCAAVKACPRKLIKQEEAYDAPMGTGMPCRACGDCALACPVRAIRITPA
jgi:translation initiation factor RLI1